VAIAEIMGLKKSMFASIENELKIMQHIRHPNALLFIGVSSKDDRFYIITELAPRGTLEDLLRQKGAELSWLCKMRMASEVSGALAYLHDRGVYHRDLKVCLGCCSCSCCLFLFFNYLFSRRRMCWYFRETMTAIW
jgi:serine/threonine protein kinase